MLPVSFLSRLKGSLIIFPRKHLYATFKMNPAVSLLFCVVSGSLVHEEEVGTVFIRISALDAYLILGGRLLL